MPNMRAPINLEMLKGQWAAGVISNSELISMWFNAEPEDVPPTAIIANVIAFMRSHEDAGTVPQYPRKQAAKQQIFAFQDAAGLPLTCDADEFSGQLFIEMSSATFCMITSLMQIAVMLMIETESGITEINCDEQSGAELQAAVDVMNDHQEALLPMLQQFSKLATTIQIAAKAATTETGQAH